MDLYEILATIFSGLALLVSVISAIMAIKASANSRGANQIAANALNEAKKANATAMGNLELLINECITATKEKVSEIMMQMAPLLSKKQAGTITQEEIFTLDFYETILRTSIENNINSYENACMKYLDNKIDTDRFKKTYFEEIRLLVEDSNHKKYFNAVTSKFKAILKVYDAWFNLEK